MNLVPKNWAIFQHYKNRRPPWIKLHRNLLDDRQFISLPLASKALAPMLWLLASEQEDGKFNASIEELAFRLRMTEKEVEAGLKPLIEKGFFLDASTMLAPRLQLATPETETETEKRQTLQRPEGVDVTVWRDFVQHRKRQRADVTVTALCGIQREAKKAGWTLEQALRECVVRGWRGFKADWVEKQNTEGKLNAI